MSPGLSQPPRIGLLGGSFNPAHAGHREISLTAIESLSLDAVWWLVTPGNPLKNARDYAPLEERLAHAETIADHPNIIISNFEQRHNLQYTVDTLKTLIDFNPTTHFIWLMGADSLETFHLWRDWKKITQLVSIAVFNRPGYKPAALDSIAATHLASYRHDERDAENFLNHRPPAWIFFSATNNPISSTTLRAANS